MNAEAAKNNRGAHRIALNARESMEVHGVTDVVSFDEQTVILETVCGNMTVEGASLHIHVLSMEEGVVTMDGRVDSIQYYEMQATDADRKNRFFGRLFR